MRSFGEEALPSATSMAGEHVSTKGKVKFFNETKGYGFLTRDEGGDVFVHRTDLPADIGPLYEGRAMNFDVEMTTRGLRAINITSALGAE
jgi:cold shock CspA family protein